MFCMIKQDIHLKCVGPQTLGANPYLRRINRLPVESGVCGCFDQRFCPRHLLQNNCQETVVK